MTDAFTTAARAEGQSRIAAMLESAGASADIRAWFPAGFEKGAAWAQDHLAAQEPTTAEVKAARRAFERHSIFRRKGELGPSNCVECGHPYDARHEGLTDHAVRAALTAAKEARS